MGLSRDFEQYLNLPELSAMVSFIVLSHDQNIL